MSLSENVVDWPIPGAEKKASIRVLVVEDEQTLRDSCISVLRQEGYDATGCGRADEARDHLQRGAFDIVLLDLFLPSVRGMELLGMCLARNPDTRVIVMTGSPTLESGLEALRAGAWDYLPKPFTATHLQILVGRAASETVPRRASGATRAPAGHSERIPLLGNAPAFVHAVELARKVARADASVFITGESGTGKEVIAEFIHHTSPRRNRPWVAVNCAALPEMLLESEMFGHIKGAFTGAVRDKQGLLEAADGGTFFLDELTEMTQTIQAKLLRAVQDGKVRRVGSESVDATVNVRFISATNRDPKQAVEQGILRQDLFYRLSVVPIRIPPLRERGEDVPLLANHFLGVYWKRHRDPSEPRPTFGTRALRSLQMREWKGNVRELQNVMEHAVVLLDAGCEIQPSDIPDADGMHDEVFETFEPGPLEPAESGGEGGGYHEARERALARFERTYIQRLVTRTGANMSQAARAAGIDRTTLYRLMDKHHLERNAIITASRERNDPME